MQDPTSSLVDSTGGAGRPIPPVARVITITLMMITTIVLAFCMTRRVSGVANWRRLRVPQWLVLSIYLDSLLFVITTAILTKSFNLNDDVRICDGAILLCIVCYMSTKVLLYYFLVEKVYVIRNPWESRLKDKLYLFNVFGVILPYVVLVILSFVYRIAYIDTAGKCIIGINKEILFPLTSFEIVLNVYLTSLFLRPLQKLYDGKQTKNSQGGAKAALKTMAMRTFVGSCATLVSTAINLGVLAGLEGEKGWICLMLCNLDILFAVTILHWATSLDKGIEEDGTKHPTAAGNTGAVEQRTYRADSTTSQGLKTGSMIGGRRTSTVLTWEDMELNSIEFDTKLGGIREEVTDINLKDVKDIV